MLKVLDFTLVVFATKKTKQTNNKGGKVVKEMVIGYYSNETEWTQDAVNAKTVGRGWGSVGLPLSWRVGDDVSTAGVPEALIGPYAQSLPQRIIYQWYTV